jgi:hypothetical protein
MHAGVERAKAATIEGLLARRGIEVVLGEHHVRKRSTEEGLELHPAHERKQRAPRREGISGVGIGEQSFPAAALRMTW